MLDKARRKPFEPLKLNIGSTLVIGKEDLSLQNDLINKQFNYYTSSITSKTFSEKGVLMIALPKSIANNENLQMKLVKEVQDKKEIYYIDL